MHTDDSVPKRIRAAHNALGEASAAALATLMTVRRHTDIGIAAPPAQLERLVGDVLESIGDSATALVGLAYCLGAEDVIT